MNSQSVINTMEVLSTKPINELATEATIKVCYVSDKPNRNGTVISEKIGREIAATLPGAPIVGFFKSEDNDFVEHSRRLTIDDEGFKFEDLTKPYGFVSPLDQPWYQNFVEDGEVRKYLMCKGYLWTRQYSEAQSVKQKGQSMELNEDDVSGYYDGDVFVFTHATLDKLCILGDHYEPCFEGANIVTSYSYIYNDFAEEIENTIGRRYYVLEGKLVEKQEELIDNQPVTEEPVAAPEVGPIVEPVTEPAEQEGEEPKAEPAAESAAEEPKVEPAPVVEFVQQLATGSDLTVEATTTVSAHSDLSEEDLLYIMKRQENEEELEKLKSQIEQLQFDLSEQKTLVSSLENELQQYKAKEKAADDKQKEEIVTYYSTILSEDLLNATLKDTEKLSSEEVESKLSLVYMREQRQSAKAKEKESAEDIQVNVNTFSLEENLPDFVKQALEYDRTHNCI